MGIKGEQDSSHETETVLWVNTHMHTYSGSDEYLEANLNSKEMRAESAFLGKMDREGLPEVNLRTDLEK